MDGGGFRVDDFGLGAFDNTFLVGLLREFACVDAGWFRLLQRFGCVGYWASAEGCFCIFLLWLLQRFGFVEQKILLKNVCGGSW